ncbi:PREDICTED: uncharacterized protein LOC106808600 [Priapulus caudatus]|uniref:Uncharacterized protein LOC106808600 n=1 Tax=Priapulus caudatus TaxID=37621 RepID=A0ABM1E3U0_PRICU|nr:PREDICTED: uncharacterized protein LOC106808600 [Priapulus caudatus]
MSSNSSNPDDTLQSLQEMFSGKLDPDTVHMILSECHFNVDEAIETLCMLASACEEQHLLDEQLGDANDGECPPERATDGSVKPRSVVSDTAPARSDDVGGYQILHVGADCVDDGASQLLAARPSNAQMEAGEHIAQCEVAAAGDRECPGINTKHHPCQGSEADTEEDGSQPHTTLSATACSFQPRSGPSVYPPGAAPRYESPVFYGVRGFLPPHFGHPTPYVLRGRAPYDVRMQYHAAPHDGLLRDFALRTSVPEDWLHGIHANQGKHKKKKSTNVTTPIAILSEEDRNRSSVGASGCCVPTAPAASRPVQTFAQLASRLHASQPDAKAKEGTPLRRKTVAKALLKCSREFLKKHGAKRHGVWTAESIELALHAGGFNSQAERKVASYMLNDIKLLVLMRGCPGSGKTTLASKLKHGGVILSTDDYFEGKKGYKFQGSQLEAAHEWNKCTAKQFMLEGKSPVIIDNTNTQAWEMKPYVVLARQHRYAVEMIEPMTSWKFKAGQLAKKNSHGVTKQSIEKIIGRYERNITISDVMAQTTAAEMAPQKKSADAVYSKDSSSTAKAAKPSCASAKKAKPAVASHVQGRVHKSKRSKKASRKCNSMSPASVVIETSASVSVACVAVGTDAHADRSLSPRSMPGGETLEIYSSDTDETGSDGSDSFHAAEDCDDNVGENVDSDKDILSCGGVTEKIHGGGCKEIKHEVDATSTGEVQERIDAISKEGERKGMDDICCSKAKQILDILYALEGDEGIDEKSEGKLKEGIDDISKGKVNEGTDEISYGDIKEEINVITSGKVKEEGNGISSSEINEVMGNLICRGVVAGIDNVSCGRINEKIDYINYSEEHGGVNDDIYQKIGEGIVRGNSGELNEEMGEVSSANAEVITDNIAYGDVKEDVGDLGCEEVKNKVDDCSCGIQAGIDGTSSDEIQKVIDDTSWGEIQEGIDGTTWGEIREGIDGASSAEIRKGIDNTSSVEIQEGIDDTSWGVIQEGIDGTSSGEIQKVMDDTSWGVIHKGIDGTSWGEIREGIDDTSWEESHQSTTEKKQRANKEESEAVGDVLAPMPQRRKARACASTAMRDLASALLPQPQGKGKPASVSVNELPGGDPWSMPAFPAWQGVTLRAVGREINAEGINDGNGGAPRWRDGVAHAATNTYGVDFRLLESVEAGVAGLQRVRTLVARARTLGPGAMPDPPGHLAVAESPVRLRGWSPKKHALFPDEAMLGVAATHPAIALMLDKGCSTEDDNTGGGGGEGGGGESVAFLQACFPDAREEDLRDVVEKCGGDVDWAMNLVLDDSGFLAHGGPLQSEVTWDITQVEAEVDKSIGAPDQSEAEGSIAQVEAEVDKNVGATGESRSALNALMETYESDSFDEEEDDDPSCPPCSVGMPPPLPGAKVPILSNCSEPTGRMPGIELNLSSVGDGPLPMSPPPLAIMCEDVIFSEKGSEFLRDASVGGEEEEAALKGLDVWAESAMHRRPLASPVETEQSKALQGFPPEGVDVVGDVDVNENTNNSNAVPSLYPSLDVDAGRCRGEALRMGPMLTGQSSSGRSTDADESDFILTLDVESAASLQQVFGPIGFFASTGKLEAKHRRVLLPVQLAAQIYQHWAVTQMSSILQEAITPDHITADEVLAYQLQDEENRKGEEKHTIPLPPTKLTEIMDEELAWQLCREDQKVKLNTAELDFATTLKLKELQERFPSADKELLDSIFVANNFALGPTIEELRNSGVRELSLQSVAGTSRLGQSTSAAMHLAGDPTLETGYEAGSDFQQLQGPEYHDFRAEAFQHHKLRQECFQKAAVAHGQNMHQVAVYYGQQGRLHTQKILEANSRAAERILHYRNAETDANMLDVHGLHVTEAIDAVERFLACRASECAQSATRYISIITGRGVHSKGGSAKIKPAVIDYLRRHNYRVAEPQPGMVQVYLN